MSENIFKFVPKGGEEVRIKQQLQAVGQRDDEALLTRSIEEFDLTMIESAWQEWLDTVAVPSVDMSDEALMREVNKLTWEQVRLALVYHYTQIMFFDDAASQINYVIEHPEIMLYLHRVAGESQ